MQCRKWQKIESKEKFNEMLESYVKARRGRGIRWKLHHGLVSRVTSQFLAIFLSNELDFDQGRLFLEQFSYLCCKVGSTNIILSSLNPI